MGNCKTVTKNSDLYSSDELDVKFLIWFEDIGITGKKVHEEKLSKMSYHNMKKKCFTRIAKKLQKKEIFRFVYNFVTTSNTSAVRNREIKFGNRKI